MFADDIKVYRKILTKADCDSLQNDLNELAAWSKHWLLDFNAEKCVVLRICAALTYQYSLNGIYLQEVSSQKDLGVTVNNFLTPANHIQQIVSKANQKTAMFRRCFTGFSEVKVTTFYQSIVTVRPALEYIHPPYGVHLQKKRH